MTPTQKEHIQYLLARFLEGTILPKEEQQLFFYIEEEKDNSAWQELLEEFMSAEQEIIINKEEYQPMINAILNKRRAKIRSIGWKQYIAAACVILLLGLATFTIISKRSGKSSQQLVVAHDVPAPTNTRAVITLADGSKVYLDSLGNGVIAQQKNVSVVKNGKGEIVYQGASLTTDHSPLTYNTLFNPRGSKIISLTLSDGTKVWLNSESSLKYPIAFNADSREVEITGEAYFEVYHDAKQPFKVHLPNGSIVEDIGTSFNINAYPDEDAVKTTLVEGSVKLTASNAATAAVKLKPGQQVIENTTLPHHFITTSPDIDEVVAWKNGKFIFNKTDIQTTMRQISRWYDVDIEYRGSVKGGFIGSIQRKENVSQVLKMLEMTGAVHFQIEGKKIIVMP